MRALRSLLRWSLRLVVVVVVVTLLALTIVYGSLRSGLVAASLDRFITRLAQKEGEFFVRVEGVSGRLPEQLRVRKVEIGDYYGVWLTIEDAEATWHPFDVFHPRELVKWRINVDDLRARRVEWTRLPKDGPDEIDTPFRWDRFIRIVVGHLRVDELDLAGSILGGARARVSAEGSGILGEWEHGFVRLDLAHVDDRTGTARIDLRTHGSPLELTGTISAEEGPGGALAALARLPDAGAVKLDVRASGPMRDWYGEADVSVASIGRLHAETRLAFTAAGPFEVTGSFDPVKEQRDRWLVGEGAPMALSAKGAWAPDVELRLDRVLLTADGRELSAGGRLDLASLVFDVHGQLEHERAGEVVATTLVDVRGAKIEGKGVLGAGGKLEATLDLVAPVVGGVSSRELHVSVKAADAEGDSVPTFDLAANAVGLGLEDGPLPLFGETARLVAAGRVDLASGVLAADRLSLEGGALTVKGALSFGDDWQSMKAGLKADASSLDSLTRVFATRVSGSASAAIDLTAKSDWQDLAMKVRASTADVAIGEAGWNALLAGTATLEADVQGAPRGPAHGDLVLRAAGIEATAKAEVGADGRGLEGNARILLDNLSRLAEASRAAEPSRAAIAGRVEATARAHGSLDRFDLDVAVRGDRFSWEGLRFDSLTADVEAEGLPATWSATVRSRATYGKFDASLDAGLSMPATGRLVVRDLVLRGPGTEGNASLDVDLDRFLASGSLRLKSEDLALWRPMTGLAIGGAVDVDATLGVSGGAAAPSQQVSATATVKHGVIPVEGSELFVDALEILAQGIEVGARPRGSARVHASQVRYGDRVLVDGLVTATGDGRLWNIETRLDGRHGEDLRLDASGTLLPGPPLDLTLARAKAEVGETAVELLEPAKFRYAPGDAAAWSTGPLALRVGETGRLRGQAETTRGRTRVEAEATAIPLSIASRFFPDLDLEGSIDGRLKIDGTSLATASGELSLRGHDVATVGLETQGIDPVDVQVDARFRTGRVSATAGLVGMRDDTKLALTLEAPLDAASGSAPFVAGLVWKGEMAETLALLPLGDDSLSGRIDADLRLTGTINAPRVTGRAVVDGGKWEQATTGLVLRDLHAEFEGHGTSLELKRLAATDGENGTVNAQGRLRFGTLPAFDAEFDLEATNAMLARLDVITARADAKLALRASRSAEAGAAVSGSINGRVRIEDARIEIPQRFVSDVPEIDVIEVGAEPASGSAAAARRLALALDVEVVGDNRIFVTGRGLESEWSSDIHVRGDTGDPRIHGKVSSVRGQLSLLGRRFDVSSATLRFDGEKGNVPYLTLTARAEANDITAIAEVTGPATRPVIELRSEPSLPRDEVLSRVLFGQSAANLTPLQSVQLARSVAELTGSPLGGGGDLISGVGRTLGFDRLAIESSGSDGAAALTASKYLTDNVYLRVQGGLTPESSKLSLEWKVFKHITIESDVSQDAQGEVGATWRWDY